MNERINFSDLFCKIVSFLEKAKIDYLLIWGVAAGVWGKPRVIEDIDFIIFTSGLKWIQKLSDEAEDMRIYNTLKNLLKK